VRGKALLVLLMLAGAAARAQQIEVVSPQPDNVSVTIYRDLFALVTETRTVDLPEGPVTVSFEGVVETLLPASAVVTDTGRPLAERNFDYDALTPNNLLTRSIGKSVTITRTLPGSGKVVQTRATVVAANDAGITLRTDQGNEVLHCSGLPEHLTFDEIPGDLHARPKLSVQLAAGQPGKRTIRLSYLARGFAWKAAYVAHLNTAGDRMDLTAWITLQNLTQASFRGAQVQVVAGKLHLLAEEDRGTSSTGDSDDYYDESSMDEAREEARQRLASELDPKDATLQLFSGCYALPVPPEREDHHFEEMREIVVTGFRGSMMSAMEMKRDAMGVVQAVREELGDYQLYRLPLPTDLNARQTKQAVFLVKPRVKIEKFYRFEFDIGNVGDDEPKTPESVIAFENRKTSGLGEPLPAGLVRVFNADGERDIFLGEAKMYDKPVNLPVELAVSKAMDLGLEFEVTYVNREDLLKLNLRDRTEVEVRTFNAKSVPVTLELRQYIDRDSVLTNSTDIFRRKDGNFVWRLRVPANGTRVVNYRVEWPMLPPHPPN
jgi:hypothetical protein